MSDRIIEHVSSRENQRIGRIVRQAVKAGKLVRPLACAWCGATEGPIVAHHPDYARPLMVVWICQPCHAAHHRHYGPERRLIKAGF